MALPKRLQFGLAQLGRKPEKDKSIAVLISADGLPSDGWKVLDQRTWRIGSVGSSTPWGDRAHEAGGIVAWRSFAQGESRWLWTQVLPYASPEDADSALQALPGPGSFMKNLRSQVQPTAEPRLLLDFEIPNTDGSLAIEQETDGPRGPTASRIAAGRVGSTVFACAFSGVEPWPWTEVVEIAALQARQIRDELDRLG